MTRLIIPAIGWLSGWALLARVKPCRPAPVQAGLAQKLTVIIPARNEEKNLPRLLASLTSQPGPPAEIIVVNDASTDRTAAVAGEFGATVADAPPLPAGWRGKTWACRHGAALARGEWLLFLDADTWLEPGGLPAVLAEFSTAGGALSVAPLHRVRAWYEQFSVFFNLIMPAGTGAFTVLGDHLTPRGLLGQFLLIEAAAYRRVGGHSAVKGEILENFRLAEILRAAGVPLRCRGGRGVAAMRMYPQGWREMMDGWGRGFASGAGKTPLPLLLLAICWLSGLAMAAGALPLAREAPVHGLVYALYAVQVGWLMRRVGAFHWATALLYPAPLGFYFFVFSRSLWRAVRKKPVAWKGRVIRAD